MILQNEIGKILEKLWKNKVNGEILSVLQSKTRLQICRGAGRARVQLCRVRSPYFYCQISSKLPAKFNFRKTQSSLLSIIVNKTSEDLSPEIPLEASVPNQPSPVVAPAEQVTEKIPRKCHICRKPLRGSLEDRQTHMMKCSNKAKVQIGFLFIISK
jgi:hypothetical protein